MNSKQITPIDYICFSSPQFTEEEEFFSEVLDLILKKTGISITKIPLDTNWKYSIKIQISHKGKKQEINLGSIEDDQHDDETKENQKEEHKEEEDYEENEAMKKKLIPKLKRKQSVLCNLYPNYDKYGMIYLNFSELKKIPENFKLNDLIELLIFFKRKNSIIFTNFYKNVK